MMTKLKQVHELGQSIWYDHLRRSLITTGELQRLLAMGVRGVTSNPTIFEQAIAGSADYDAALRRLVDEDMSISEIYEALVLDDITRTADLLCPLYDATDGADGYVSLEVSPRLAHDTNGTIVEARRLWGALNRPNVMIKVPATPAGIPAIQTLIGEGININVTLIFSVVQYEAVTEAFIAGLEQRLQAGGNLRSVASVASFFVSRVDTAVDRELEQRGFTSVQGKAAIANAKVAYAVFRRIFSQPRWQPLQQHGARVQRPLWASTGTKNPHYPDTLYIDSLIGPDTVNTAPPAAITAFLDHGIVAPTLEQGLNEAHATLAQLTELDIDLDAVTQQLQDEGVASFATSFESLLASIANKRARLLAEQEHRVESTEMLP
jgi:transaldolase